MLVTIGSLLCSHVRPIAGDAAAAARARRGHGHQARLVHLAGQRRRRGLMFPVVGGFGLMSNRASDVVANGSAQLVEGEVPAVSTMVDAKGNPLAWLYTQRRFEVPSDQIANTMKLAIVSIEDKRFAEHNGVDWKGTLTGLSGYVSGAADTRGGSTIEQQYVKNYQLLVIAQTDAEKRAAIETTPARKLREIRMALTLDKTFTKPEILTRYLNLVSFGNGAFGVQDAAQTYFGINASELNWQQAALLAGMVQSTSTLNPYTNPEGALARRNLVLDTMIDNVPQEADALRAAKQQPLGVLPQPKELPRGCIAAGDRAFFCDYVLDYLARAGISKEQVAKGGYLIKTTLDPDVQNTVKSSIDGIAAPDLDGVASVMSVIRPGKDSHPVRRDGEQPHLRAEPRRGRDHAAAAVLAGRRRRRVDLQGLHHLGRARHGHGHQRPARRTGPVRGQGPRQRRREGLPAGHVVRAERRQLPRRHRASPTRWRRRPTPRSPSSSRRSACSAPSTWRSSSACAPTRCPAPPATTTPTATRAWPTSSSGRTWARSPSGPSRSTRSSCPTSPPRSASGGTWCPPNPIDKVFDRNGKDVSVTTETCEQVVPEGLANTLANAMSKDDQSGTAAGSANSAGWSLPVSGKTGTTEAHRSSGFFGFTSAFAAANYIYDDSTSPSDLCSFPLRQCGSGNLYGGNEPARTWFTAMKQYHPRRRGAAADRSALRRRCARLEGAQRGGHDAGPGTAASEGRRLPGRRPGHAGQQRLAGGLRRRHLPGRSDGPRVDHHDPDQQRHRAGPAAAAAGIPVDPNDPNASAARSVRRS